ncbi:MAG: hypothetical protein DWQ40_08520 [Actinobacteria bacterium]|nr:MAG: hypothetical protein DWQ40_08520 [Actinomycetota bacterium]
MAVVPGIPAEASEGFPALAGSEWTDIVREAFSRLPNLTPAGEPGSITGDAALDDRIWEIAFARGYEMRPTPASGLVVQDGHSMQEATADAWESLQAAAAAAGHDIVIHSAHRSVATQKAIFNADLDGSSDAAINDTLDFHAPPGASRHHTGYALDIKAAGGTIGGFEDTGAYEWISADNYQNAMLHGFVPSYPPDAPNQGPLPEPWEFVYVGLEVILDSDELLFYRNDGTFKYYNVNEDASLGSLITSGGGYSKSWSSITALDLDDVDNQDELLFYRDDGVFKFYDIASDGALGSPMLEGDGYSGGWSIITAVDLDGDHQDELLFYRSSDGTFKYYAVNPDGSLGSPIKSGSGYSTGWTAIEAVELDGGGDELLFYRTDGTFKFYAVSGDASLGSPILEGDGYTPGWSSITALDLDGGGHDELLFYKDDGTFKYYDVTAGGSLGSPIRSGVGYSQGWSVVAGIDLD